VPLSRPGEKKQRKGSYVRGGYKDGWIGARSDLSTDLADDLSAVLRFAGSALEQAGSHPVPFIPDESRHPAVRR